MNSKLLIAGLFAAAVIPGAALAQPYDPGCVRSNQQNNATGAVLGALGGALIGNALGGHRDRGTDTAVGAIGGAVAGGAIASSQDHPCPAGYGYAPPPPPPPGYGGRFWQGAPQGIHERIDFIQSRLDRAIREGWLSPRETDSIQDEMRHIRREDDRLRDQDGGRLRPEDRGYMQSLLDNVSQRLHWAEHNG